MEHFLYTQMVEVYFCQISEQFYLLMFLDL